MYDLLISNQEQCFGTHQFITMPYIDLLLFKRVVPIIFFHLILKVLLPTVSRPRLFLTLPLLVITHQVYHHNTSELIRYAVVVISLKM